MMTIHKSLIPVLFGLALVPLGLAKAEEQHHTPDAATGASTVTDPAEQPATAPVMGTQTQGMSMMDMMGQGGMGMMGQGGMGMMNMMGQDAVPMLAGNPTAGMPMSDIGTHLEGRIAFLRAELGITEAQEPQWESFAQALRDGAAKLKQAQLAVPKTATDLGTFLQRASLQEEWLGARLEGLKTIKAAFAGLQAVLSDDQMKIAEALLARPICLGQMGMM